MENSMDILRDWTHSKEIFGLDGVSTEIDLDSFDSQWGNAT